MKKNDQKTHSFMSLVIRLVADIKNSVILILGEKEGIVKGGRKSEVMSLQSFEIGSPRDGIAHLFRRDMNVFLEKIGPVHFAGFVCSIRERIVYGLIMCSDKRFGNTKRVMRNTKT